MELNFKELQREKIFDFVFVKRNIIKDLVDS